MSKYHTRVLPVVKWYFRRKMSQNEKALDLAGETKQPCSQQTLVEMSMGSEKKYFIPLTVPFSSSLWFSSTWANFWLVCAKHQVVVCRLNYAYIFYDECCFLLLVKFCNYLPKPACVVKKKRSCWHQFSSLLFFYYLLL